MPWGSKRRSGGSSNSSSRDGTWGVDGQSAWGEGARDFERDVGPSRKKGWVCMRQTKPTQGRPVQSTLIDPDVIVSVIQSAVGPLIYSLRDPVWTPHLNPAQHSPNLFTPHTQSILEYNGGACVAMVGKNCVAIARYVRVWLLDVGFF